MISSKTVNFNAEVLNLVIFSNLVDFFVNLMIFAKTPVATLVLSNVYA